MKRLIILGGMLFSLLYIPYVFAQGGEELLNEAEEQQIEKKVDHVGRAMLGMKIELLNWKKNYYVEHSLSMQLREMNRLWGTPEFQETQRKIRELDKELKRLSVL